MIIFRFSVLAMLLCSCMQSKEDSLDNAVDEVLKHKQGVTIEIKPEGKSG